MAFTNATDLIRLLSNRPLVPFLGAGISVASGFPSIRQLNQYLSKVDFAIEQGVYSHRYASNKADADYRNHPSRFLLDFGWPEIGQLDADLWQWLTTTTQERDGRTRLVNLEKLRKEDSGAPDWLNHSLPIMDRLSYDLTAVRPADFNHDVDYSLAQRDYLRAIVQYHLRRDLRRLESGADDAALRQWKRWKAFYFGRIPKNREDGSLPDKEPDLLYGNWESLLDHLCEGSLDLIDQLFTQLEVGRRPTLAHLYLAFLKQKLDSPLFLTTNFDSFIEQALRQQGLDYRVFDVHRDAQLPDAELVKRQFSLVKLHGSSYGLRLGERLRYPLDSESQNQILRILPPNALVLVMGFSGYERRMLQLLRLVAEQGPVKGRASDGKIRDDPRIVWLTLEELQGWPGQLQREYQTQIAQVKIADAGTFLQELYFKLGKSFPASQTGYSALTDMVINKASHGTRQLPRSEWLKETLSSYLDDSDTCGNHSAVNPVVTELPVDSKTAERINRKKTLKALRQPIHLFIPAALNDWFQSETPFQQSEHASCAAAEFVKSLGFEYRPIWVSFENHHTVAGVITEFFTKVRAYDPYSPRPPLNLSSLNQEEISHGLEKAVTRILDVFQSGKYVLVLDLMESFGRPQTMHHGVPTYDVFEEDHQKKLRSGFSRRVDEITRFCKLLLTSANVYQGTAAGFGESYLCLTVGGPPSRRFDDSAEASSTTENDIRGLLSTVVQEIPRTNQDVCVHRISSYPYTKVKGAGSTAEAAHWMSEAAAGSHIDRSSLRLDDARALVQFLTDDTSGDHVPDRVERAFLGLLSVFRRARAIPLIQSVIERWVTSATAPGRTVNSTSLTQRIQMLLEVIERQNFRLPANDGYIAEYCEGECIWMYREVRDRMYKSMTEQLSVTKWFGMLSSNGDVTAEDAESASKDGVLAFTWHWAAARTYYADVYRPTQDITAFYEYLYHRISSLRIMTLLKAIICRSKIDTGSLHQLAVELAAFSPLGGYERESFAVSLSRLREEGLTTLHRALVRNRDVLRSSATPSTLKSWARQFLDREIHDLSGSVFADGRGDLPFSKIGFGQSEQLAALVECFNRSSAESSGSQVCKSDRQSYLALIGLLEFFDRLRCDGEAADLALKEGETIALHRVERLRKAGSQADMNDQLRVSMHAAVHDLHSLRMDQPEECPAGAAEIDQYLHEGFVEDDSSELRKFRELRAKWQLRDYRYWQHFNDRRRNWFAGQRRLSDQATDALQVAESLAIEYEKVLRATATVSDDDKRHRSSALILRARSMYLREKFREAHKWLDLSAAGLTEGTPEQRISLASMRLNRGELLIFSAHWHRFIKGREADKPADAFELDLRRAFEVREECPVRRQVDVNAHLQKIRRAADELATAERLLLESPHLPVWRINVYLGLAVCASEELMYDLESEKPDHASSNFAKCNGALEQRVLKAMGYIRNALDTLPVTCDETNSFSKGLELFCYSVWQQLYVMFLISAAKLRVQTKGDHRSFVIDVLSRASAWADRDIDRWKNWGRAMRLIKISDLAAGFDIPEDIFQRVENCSTPSLATSALALAMHESTIESPDAGRPSFPQRCFNSRRNLTPFPRDAAR